VKFIDGLLRPATIKSGVYVADGLAYFTIGNFVSVSRPLHTPDLPELIKIVRPDPSLRRTNHAITYTIPKKGKALDFSNGRV
jgi:hypothetical protein